MRRMDGLFAEVALDASCAHEMAQEFGVAMEQAVRDFVSQMGASGGGAG